MGQTTGGAESGQSIAILGGGCFWCLEAVYQNMRGVASVTSGYMGGHLAYPSYEEVCGKRSGHAEVVRIAFDSAVISYAQLLDIFFVIHDPTTPDRQGNDVGPQYRSVIFAMDETQLQAARNVIAGLSGFSSPIVTEVVDASSGDASIQRFARPNAQAAPVGVDVALVFWPAEDGHQNYFRTHPHQGYCAFVVAPKVHKAFESFKALIAQSPS